MSAYGRKQREYALHCKAIHELVNYVTSKTNFIVDIFKRSGILELRWIEADMQPMCPSYRYALPYLSYTTPYLEERK